MDHSPQKILVIQTAFLGDVVLTLPLLQAIRERWPAAHRAVVLVPRTRDILDGHPAVDEIILYDKKNERGWRPMARTIRQIRSRGFDICILPHRSFRSALIARIAGIPRRVGFEASPGSIFYTDRVAWDRRKHVSERHLDLLRPFGAAPVSIEGGRISPVLPISSPAAEKVDHAFREAGIRDGDLVVAMAPGSAWETKRWTPEGFAAVADALSKSHGARVLLLGSKEEAPIADRIMERTASRPVNFLGQDLKELAATLSRCDLLITNDNGSMHIASALSIPIVAVFGSTSPASGLGPYSDKARIVEKTLPCRPCGLHGRRRCPQLHFRCMLEITPGEVVEAAEKQLSLYVKS